MLAMPRDCWNMLSSAVETHLQLFASHMYLCAKAMQTMLPLLLAIVTFNIALSVPAMTC